MTYIITQPCIESKDASCVTVCPVDCISGEKKGLHVIDQEACIKCEACITKCPVKCIVKQ